jgi:hypothetical protein
MVQDRREFVGSNLFAVYNNGKYVVYSYGDHFPLFVYHNGKWYENSDRYSVSTSKHRTQSHPHCDTLPLNTSQMKELIRDGGGA